MTTLDAKNFVPGISDTDAELVNARIDEVLSSFKFRCIPPMVFMLHEALFQDLDESEYMPGDYAPWTLKPEPLLNGDSVLFTDTSMIDDALVMGFDWESDFHYASVFHGAQLTHIARFSARLWQIHPFKKGNTLVAAVFIYLRLKELGFNPDISFLNGHAEYLHGSFVRANYRNEKANVFPDRSFCVKFFNAWLNGKEEDLNPDELVCTVLFEDPSLRKFVR